MADISLFYQLAGGYLGSYFAFYTIKIGFEMVEI